jgi:site-specific DNA recombinase
VWLSAGWCDNFLALLHRGNFIVAMEAAKTGQKTMSKKIPAVAYYRMSSDRQEKSIPDQRTAVEKYAKKHGYQLLREYADKGISGDKTEKRKAFQTMIRDAGQLADFQVILCWDQDRFGRFDSLEAGKWICPLRDVGVSLATIAQGKIDWNDFAGRLIYTIHQEGKHQYLRDIAHNALRGIISRGKEGLWPSGRAPFGYVIGSEGKLVLGDPVAVQAVKDAFAYRSKGLGYRAIARRMNDKQTPSPSGGNWSHDAVRCILGREAYTGVIVWGAKPQGAYYVFGCDATPVDVRHISQKKAVPLRIEDAHPAIITRDAWQVAQAVKAKPFSRKGGEGSALAGLLYCGRCGNTMYSQSMHRKSGQRNPNYVCATYHKGRGCGYCTVPQDAMLKAVADVIRERVLLGSQKRLVQTIEQELNRRFGHDTHASQREQLQAKIDKLDRQIDRAADRLLKVDDSVFSKVEEKLSQLGRERDAAAAERKGLVLPEKPQLNAKQVASQVWQLDEVLRSAPASDVRASLSKIVDRIDLSFVKGKKTRRGQAFQLVGAEMSLCTKPWVSSGKDH